LDTLHLIAASSPHAQAITGYRLYCWKGRSKGMMSLLRSTKPVHISFRMDRIAQAQAI
jgi:hypothetical protein